MCVLLLMIVVVNFELVHWHQVAKMSDAGMKEKRQTKLISKEHIP